MFGGVFKDCSKQNPKPDRSRGNKPSSLSLSDHVIYSLTVILLGLKHMGQNMNFYTEIHLHRILLA